jgi:hypothetical protein
MTQDSELAGQVRRAAQIELNAARHNYNSAYNTYADALERLNRAFDDVTSLGEE